MEFGQRILILGSGGSGKSTLARQLVEKLDLPIIHLDAHFWHPGWVNTPREEWRRMVAEMVTSERWIIDGNYSNSIDIRLAAADAVIFLDLPIILCLYRVIKRRLMYREGTRPDIAPGCPEKIDWEFLKWIADYPRCTRPRILQLLEQERANKRIVTLKTPAQVRRFLDEVTPLPEEAGNR